MRDGHLGTAQPYEGCWTSCTFSVLVDTTRQWRMMRTSDVTVLVTGGLVYNAVEDVD